MNTQKPILKLGKKPAQPEKVTLKFRALANMAKLPKPPKNFGHETVYPAKGWGMLGNDTVGDCVIADAGHRSMLSNMLCGKQVAFSTENVLKTYSEITGYDPTKTDAQGNNPTDQGTDMSKAASYWRHTGILDAAGQRHTVRAYVSLDPGNLNELYAAMWLFDGNVAGGILFPDYAMDQFNAGKPWTLKRHAGQPQEGHCISMVCRRVRMGCITWGQVQPMTASFWGEYNDEAIAYITDEALQNNKSPEGWDVAALEGFLAAL